MFILKKLKKIIKNFLQLVSQGTTSISDQLNLCLCINSNNNESNENITVKKKYNFYFESDSDDEAKDITMPLIKNNVNIWENEIINQLNNEINNEINNGVNEINDNDFYTPTNSKCGDLDIYQSGKPMNLSNSDNDSDHSNDSNDSLMSFK